MKKIITYWFIAIFLDWQSTIIQSWQGEENPVMRYIWKTYRDIGFTIATLLSAFGVALILFSIRNWKGRKIIYPVFALLVTFKIIIALTNFGLLPYYLTSWFNF